MIDTAEVDRFIDDPTLLLDLFQELSERLNVNQDHTDHREREAQLLEVSRTIERLNRMGIPVPDAIRAEKVRLASVSDKTEKTNDQWDFLVKGILDILGKTKLSRKECPRDSLDKNSESVSNGDRSGGFRPSPIDFVTDSREARKRARLNQSVFWSRFGVTQSGGSRYETGRDIGGPTQILMALYALGTITDADLLEARNALGSAYKQSSE